MLICIITSFFERLSLTTVFDISLLKFLSHHLTELINSALHTMTLNITNYDLQNTHRTKYRLNLRYAFQYVNQSQRTI